MNLRLLILLLLLLTPALGGCFPLFLAAGAGTGYVMTDEESKAKVDKFFRDLEQSVRKTTRRISSEVKTKKTSASDQGNSDMVLKIHKNSVSPAKVSRGESVRVILEYEVMGAAEAGVEIQERITLVFGSKGLTLLSEDSTIRSNGIWENTLTFAVPASTEPGTYKVTQEIATKGLKRTARSSLQVL
jgi:hypothetical protein